MVTEEDVVWAYRILLNREPESALVLKGHLSCRNRTELARAFIGSEEFLQKVGGVGSGPQSPFWHYAAAFDAIGTINRYAARNIRPSASFATNFLGVRTRPEFYPHILGEQAGTVDGPPIPANWHADIAEWASCLRALDLAADRFVMLELGCGWGCWINNLGVAAKAAGKQVRLFGVEGDQESLRFARLAIADNGLNPDEVVLSHGIAGRTGQVALFPSTNPEGGGGGAAIFNPAPDEYRAALSSGKYVEMPVIDIATLTRDEERLDFLHVDIQGAELELLSDQFEFLCQKVRYLFVGTHSKQIEGGLVEVFSAGGHWKLEMERPAMFGLTDGRPWVQIDGVQAWRNAALD